MKRGGRRKAASQNLLVVDGLAGNTERAETVENGLLEATHLGKRGVNVQGACAVLAKGLHIKQRVGNLLVVTAQTVDGGLVGVDVLLVDMVGGALGGHVGGRGSAAVGRLLLAVKAASTAKEDGHLVVEDLLASLGNGGGDARLDDGGLALVDGLEEAALGHQVGARGDRELADLEVLLAVEQRHGVEVGDNLVEGEADVGRHGGNDTVGGEKLEVLSTLTT